MEQAANNLLWTDLEAQLPILEEEVEIVQKCITYLLSGEIQEPSNPQKEEIDSALSFNVLVVDDDPIMHRITGIILKDLGIEKVTSAMSGTEGLGFVGNQP